MFGCFRRINVFGGRFFGEPPAAVFCVVHNVGGTFFALCWEKVVSLHYIIYVTRFT